MDKLSKKCPKFWRFLEYISIAVGFGGMLFIMGFLIKGIYEFLFLSQPSPINLLLPGVQIAPGIPTMTFLYWIIVIFILATVHEMSHGMFARLNKIKLKSSGFAIIGVILPILPAAFVEPDEKQLEKAKTKAKLSVLSAGSFANVVTAIISLLILFFVISPITASAMVGSGVLVTGFSENFSISESGMAPGERILTVNDENMGDVYVFIEKMSEKKPGEDINIITDKGSYEIKLEENPENSSAGYLGIQIAPYKNQALSKILAWVGRLFYWLFMANLGVGLFNLLPMGPLDGGRMLKVFLLSRTKNEKKSHKIFLIISFIFLALIIIGLLPQAIKFFSPLINLF
ncbi:MAG: site-2 protease family protein [Nanoarchaeota archaeon]|nr:M50 family metallopeptidase [Nanoarchaeota archaeon]MBU1444833.1 M50 family metallopeptidase [Nanoarchaeota archaeon]MBU2406661.1 M50 family metallopeptidase [Nanoarchaeota archaeon]MBU2420001.1 M50 family metallopeptidase [Nanoarchaeota archaeon]MBU2475432.1 M50 family metallopeptidase [Nanoarchaeota archaeon]